MQIRPILAALKHHKAGTVLIVLQVALTLAIVCNAMFIIRQRIEQVGRPTGIDEANILTIDNAWVGKPTPERIDALIAADLAVLRGMPGVVDAYASNSAPLSGEGSRVMGLKYAPEKADGPVVNTYMVDEHALRTLGVRLVAGRDFRAEDVSPLRDNAELAPPNILVTKALADPLFPDAPAVGQLVYMSHSPSRIIGVVDRLQWSFGNDPGAPQRMEQVLLVPVRPLSLNGKYIVRVKPGQADRVAAVVAGALRAVTAKRVIRKQDGVRHFSDVRAEAYAGDVGMALLMSIVSVLLLAITAAGIVGLTSFWVGQRRKQIGVRRALGATRHDILSYFLTENLLIGTAGVLIGAVLAITLNLWMVTRFEMMRLSLAYVGAGVVLLLLLGQAAVLAPALRASRVSPVEATRSV